MLLLKCEYTLCFYVKYSCEVNVFESSTVG